MRQSSLNRGSYVEFAVFLKDYDANLSEHFNTSNVFSIFSKHVQSDLIEAMGCVILKEIKHEINGSEFISVVLEESSGIANVSKIFLY
jgi:hypothetical protein